MLTIVSKMVCTPIIAAALMEDDAGKCKAIVWLSMFSKVNAVYVHATASCLLIILSCATNQIIRSILFLYTSIVSEKKHMALKKSEKHISTDFLLIDLDTIDVLTSFDLRQLRRRSVICVKRCVLHAHERHSVRAHTLCDPTIIGLKSNIKKHIGS